MTIHRYNHIIKQELDKLQRILHAAARVVSRTSKYDHITPVLRELHWLPIAKRIDYKILLLTFKALHGMAPVYIADLIQVYRKERTLRSNSDNLLVIPKGSHSKSGDKSFAFAAPTLWNNLPRHCRDADTLECFKSRLKTHLFKQAYQV